MKKFTLFLSALLISAMTFAADVDLVFNSEDGLTALGIELPATDGGDGALMTELDDTKEYGSDIIMTVTHASTKTRVWKKASGALDLRTYKNGGSLTLTAPEGNVITQVVFDGAKIVLAVDGVDVANKTWTGNAATVTFAATATCNINKITVTYSEVAADVVAPPTISGETSFMGATTVKITAAEDLTIYYTTDGTEPAKNPDNEWENQYYGSFDINETTTVKAIAYDEEGNASAVVEKTFKKMEVVTCEEAVALCATKPADKYIVRGYVTAIASAYDPEWKNISFWMADTKDGGQVLQAYRAKPVDAAGIDVKVGDYVEIVGNLTIYGTTPEVNSGGLYTVANLTWAGDETNGYYINGLHPELGQIEVVLMKERWMGIWTLTMSIDKENVAEYVNIEGAPEISEDGVLTLETIVETDEAEYELNLSAAKAAPVTINAEATMALSEESWEAGIVNVIGTWNGYDLVVKLQGWNYYGYGDYADASVQITKGEGDDEEVYIGTQTAAKVEKQEDNSAILTAAFSFYTDKMTDYVVTITIANPLEPVMETVEVVSNDLELIITEEDWGGGEIYYYANMYGTCELGNIEIQFSYKDAGKTIDNLYGEWGFIETEHPWEQGLMVSYPLITVYLYPVSEGDEYVPTIDLTLVEGTVATYTDGELDTFEGQFLGSDWKFYNLKMTEAGNESAVENITTTVVPVKVIENGQLIIIKNGIKYNVAGAVVK